MFGRRLLLLIAVAATLAACSTPSASENRIEVAVEADPTIETRATATPVPTTEPVVETPSAGPTPITLSGGQGIVVPTVDPDTDAIDADDADADEGEGGATQPDDDEAEEAPTATPTPTTSPEPDGDADDEASAAPTPTVVATPTSSPTPATAATATGVPAPTTTPAPTPSPSATTDPSLLANDPVTGEPIDLGGDTSDPDVPASTDGALVRIANGSEVYTLNCLRCHGENGTGSFQASSIIGISQQYSTNQLVAELTSGHPSTFGFGDKLSGNEIRDVVAFVLDAFG